MSAATVAFLSLFMASPAESTDSEPAPRAYHLIDREIRSLMKQESTTKSEAERAEVIRRMCALYRELARDPRIAESEVFESYKIILWGRLTRVQKRLEQIESIKARRAGRKPPRDEEVLADREASQLTDAVAAQFELSTYALGGPARVFTDAGAGGGAAVADYGPALIDLIQRTIEPNFWDVQGGPGTIFYYQPLHALVVRATAEVHREIGGAIGGLRAAGR